MQTKDFHLGDILSVTTDRLVSPRHIGGVYDILGWMTGESLFTHQLPRVSDEAKPVILKMHPHLGGPEMDAAVADLSSRLSPERLAVEPKVIVAAWLAELVAKHGEMLPVPKMDADEHERIDPVSELAEKIHPSKIIVVGAPPA